MSFMQKLFGTPTNPAAAPAPAQAAVTATNDPTKMQQPGQTATSLQTAPNGVVPANSDGQSPLDKFKDIWQPTQTDPNAPKPAGPVTADQIMEAAGKVDFSKVLAQEDLAKIAAGGQDAIVALSNVLNKTMQTSYGHSAFAATKLVEQAVSQAEDRFAARLPSLINQQSSKNALLADNPAFKNPAVSPIVEMIHNQLTERFPTATPNEIAQMAKEMMAGAAQVFNPKQNQVAADKSKQPQGEDWSNYV